LGFYFAGAGTGQELAYQVDAIFVNPCTNQGEIRTAAADG